MTIHSNDNDNLTNCTSVVQFRAQYYTVAMAADSIIRDYFLQLGYENDIADVYLALYGGGATSISRLSRAVNIERTRVYRLLNVLQSIQMVETETHYKRSIVKAAPISNLRILVAKKEQEVAALRGQLQIVEETLGKDTLIAHGTRVQFYSGNHGLKQMLWNELRATGEIVGYAHRIFEEGVGKDLILSWAEEFEKRKLRARLLTGTDWVSSWKGAGAKGSGQRVGGIAYHKLSPEIFAINHARDIYNDTVAYFQWVNGDIFGFEIYNQQIADAERQIFEGFWAKSSPDKRF